MRENVPLADVNVSVDTVIVPLPPITSVLHTSGVVVSVSDAQADSACDLRSYVPTAAGTAMSRTRWGSVKALEPDMKICSAPVLSR